MSNAAEAQRTGSLNLEIGQSAARLGAAQNAFADRTAANAQQAGSFVDTAQMIAGGISGLGGGSFMSGLGNIGTFLSSGQNISNAASGLLNITQSIQNRQSVPINGFDWKPNF